MRVARPVCLILFAVLLSATSAGAQAPAVDQYTNTGSGSPNSGSNNGSNNGSNSPNNGSNNGSNPTNGPNGSSPGQSGNGGGSPGVSGNPAGGQGGSGAGAGKPSSLRLSFGSVSPSLVGAIDSALAQGGIEPSMTGRLTRAAVEDFLESALARKLSTGDAEAVGAAVGKLIVDPGPLTPAVLAALLGEAPPISPATHAVFTRSSTPKGDYADFQKGLVEGSSDVPRAYVEMSGAKTSFVEAFGALGVPTVDNIETQAGKNALVAILVSGAKGNFGSKPTADAKLVDGEVKPLSASIGNGPGDGLAGPLLLGVIVLALLWTLGMRPRRRGA